MTCKPSSILASDSHQTRRSATTTIEGPSVARVFASCASTALPTFAAAETRPEVRWKCRLWRETSVRSAYRINSSISSNVYSRAWRALRDSPNPVVQRRMDGVPDQQSQTVHQVRGIGCCQIKPSTRSQNPSRLLQGTNLVLAEVLKYFRPEYSVEGCILKRIRNVFEIPGDVLDASLLDQPLEVTLLPDPQASSEAPRSTDVA